MNQVAICGLALCVAVMIFAVQVESVPSQRPFQTQLPSTKLIGTGGSNPNPGRGPSNDKQGLIDEDKKKAKCGRGGQPGPPPTAAPPPASTAAPPASTAASGR